MATRTVMDGDGVRCVRVTRFESRHVMERNDVRNVVYYRVEVVGGAGRQWYVWRRYNEFLDLDKAIREMGVRLEMGLPQRYAPLFRDIREFWKGNHVEARLGFLQDRKKGLDMYCQSLMSHDELWREKEIQKFFGMENVEKKEVEMEEWRDKKSRLEEICSLVQRQKELGRVIQSEVDAQNRLLDELGVSIDAAQMEMEKGQTLGWQLH